MKNLVTLVVILIHSIGIAIAATDKYRIMWRSDPATTMVIGWNQISGSNPAVYYGPTDHGANFSLYPLSRTPDRVVLQNGMSNHFVRLSGLSPNTAYFFVIKDSQGVSARFWFKTAPADPGKRLSIIAGGDSRDGRAQRQNANRLVSKLRPHVVLFDGDMTHSNYDSEWRDWFDDWQLTTGSDGRMIPLIVARGNHETSDAIIVNHFDVPHPNAYYALTLGGSLLRVYTLNSETSVAGDQTLWLNNDLATNANVQWKFAQYHRPMRPHAAAKAEGTAMYQYWAPVFHQHKVQLVMECDAHVVKSTWPVVPSTGTGSDEGFIRDDDEGTVYIGEGGWGAPLRTNDDDKTWTRNSGAFNEFKWIFVDAGKIEVRAIKTDNANSVGAVSDANIFSPPANLDIWNPSNGSVITIPARQSTSAQYVKASIASGADDAEERSSGVMYLSSTDLEMVYDNSTTGNQTIGLRFAGVNVPRGATITEASLQFYADAVTTGTTNLLLKGDDVDNSPVFKTSDFNISSRPRTSASVSWIPAPWSVVDVAGQEQRSPDIKSIIQEIVNRQGWNAGNALSIIITGTGERNATSYEESPQRAASLHIGFITQSTSTTSTTYVIGSGGDDVEENSAGTVSTSSSDLELVYDNSTTGNQVVGLRFRSLALPQGAVIVSAYLQFVTDEPASGTTSLQIRAHDVGNSPGFVQQARNVSVRARTSAYVSWAPPAWTVVGEISGSQRSPDVKNILQEIVDRSDWIEGNAVTFIITGSGKRTARAYEHAGPSGAVKLVVNHTSPVSAAANEVASMSAAKEYNELIQASPNPASDKLLIHLQEDLKSRTVSYALTNESGKTALSGTRMLNNENSFDIDLSDIASGLYILRVATHKGHNTLKIIKR